MRDRYNRAKILDAAFVERIESGDLPEPLTNLTLTESGLDSADLLDLFESQVMSRQLDLMARKLAAERQGFYTIGSAGHEGNAVLGKAFRLTDMAFLHYRSGAFFVQRAKLLPDSNPIRDILLSFVASSEDPISGGRHKVLGSKPLFIPPQTSTIASHLPKAVGAAHSVDLARRMHKTDAVMPDDAVIVCSFGDASINHSTAQGAINAATWSAVQNSPMPIVFVCEDNGIGISVKTPGNWIRDNFSRRHGLHYIYAQGLDLFDTYRASIEAIDYARRWRKPVFLHLRMVRLLGHAGSDTELSYRSLQAIEEDEHQDPLLHSARILIDNEIINKQRVIETYRHIAELVTREAEKAIQRPKLKSAEEVMQPITPDRSRPPTPPAAAEKRQTLFNKEQRLLNTPQPMTRLLNLALADILLQYTDSLVFGEDVGRKGGVYSVTTGLQKKFGVHRVIDTLLDEQTILGLAIGLAHNGFLPIPEIQFLAYLHNAEDQLRGEAATLSFFSQGQYTNPMVIRIASLAYQKGFGGHFHNDNSIAVLRDIPGLIIACPSSGRDAVRMLRSCMACASQQHRIAVFLEPIALYMTRDLHDEDDGLWAATYSGISADERIEIGDIAVYGDGSDLCIISYGNGYYLSRQAAKRLQDEYNIKLRVIDLRWLAPLNEEKILNGVASVTHILIVDECRRTGSISEALMTMLIEQNQIDFKVARRLARVTAEDSFIPLAAAANLVLPDVEGIVAAALKLLTEN